MTDAGTKCSNHLLRRAQVQGIAGILATLFLVNCGGDPKDSGYPCGEGEGLTADGECEPLADGEADADTDSDSDTDTDSDADADSDSDADTDTDTDTDADLSEFEASNGISMVLISAGSFTMGSPEDEIGHGWSDEAPHQVTLTHDYYLSSVEVTQALYESVVGDNPSLFPGCGDDCPIDTITWHEAASFANALSRAAGVEECYACDGGVCATESSPYECAGYRLPTEAEWEYAARSGTTTAFSVGGDLTADEDLYECEAAVTLSDGSEVSEFAWYCLNSGGQPNQVGTLAPNSWGLYDMAGNVQEWTHDGWVDELGDATDPYGDDSSSSRARRGGSWRLGPYYLRSASRPATSPESTDYDHGMRVARTSE